MTITKKSGFRKGAGFFTLMTSIALLLMSPVQVRAMGRLQDVGEKLVVVIDPGHGGENEGTIENGFLEKSMTMVTALAMYEELSLYEGVEVYLTRTGDVENDISLDQRAAFAESVEADFLFSIHYNASADHELFGSEVWVSAFAPFNNYGYQFGYELLSDMRDYGLFIRGVKTRLGDSGDNYYGIIRCSENRGVPAVIIEHCHVDEARDVPYCDTEEELKEFGRMDATAAARYFGLKSSVLGVDYSDHPLAEVDGTVPVPCTLRDDTAPDVCEIECLDADYETGDISFFVTATDYDSPLLYYSYSLDGGRTFSPREAWPQSNALEGSCADTFTLNLKMPPETAPEVILRAYNLFDLCTESAPYQCAQIYHEPASEEVLEAMGPAEAAEGDGAATESGTEAGAGDEAREAAAEETPSQRTVSFLSFLLICLSVCFLLCFLFFVSQAISRSMTRKRRSQRRKVSGHSKNQHR